MKRDRDPYPRQYELDQQGEPSLRWWGAQCTKEAERLEQEAAIARE